MRTAFTVFYLSALVLTQACSTMTTSSRLPSIQATSRTSRIVQHERNHSLARAFPWYIFCVRGQCGDETVVKTPFTRAAHTKPHRRVTAKASATTSSETQTPSESASPESISTILFAHASAQLSKEARQALDRTLPALKGHRLHVAGYTDATVQPDGTIANEALAKQRALAVKDYLIASGISASSIQIDAKALCCYAADNDSESGRRRNRRTTIVLLP